MTLLTGTALAVNNFIRDKNVDPGQYKHVFGVQQFLGTPRDSKWVLCYGTPATLINQMLRDGRTPSHVCEGLVLG